MAVAFPNPGVPTLLSPKRRRRALKLSHWKAAAMGGAAVLTMATSVTPAGVGATAPVTTDLQQHFQLDGNIKDSDATTTWPNACDWTTIHAGTCADQALFDHTFVHDEYISGKDHSAFTNGSKDTLDISGWACDVQPFTPKDNILHTYAAAYLVPVSGDGTHRVVYMGQERQSNNGDSFAGFWLLHSSASCSAPATGSNSFSGSHVNGDLLVVSNYTNGGGNNDVTIYAWENGALNTTPVFVSANTCTSPTDIDIACAIANSAAISPTPSWSPQTLDTHEFVETGVDLTAVDEALANANPPLTGLSTCFTNFLSETRSSTSPTADLHDYAMGQTDTCPTPTLPTNDSLNGNSTSGTVGTAMTIGDSVTVTGGANPTGHVDFTLYSDSQCTVAASPAVASGDVTLVSGSASYSTSWTPSATGTYYWGVTYSGDTNNGSNSACGGTNETLSVGKASPTIATDAAGVEGTVTSGSVGSQMSVGDTATLTGFSNLVSGDQITFDLYGPTGPSTFTCNSGDHVLGPITADLNTSTGVASTGVQSFTPSAVGTYYWVASFPGDANNNGPVTEPCGGANEAVTVAAVAPSLATNASSLEGAQTTGVVGTPINVGDTGTLTGFADLVSGDTMTFGLYGPTSTGEPSCTNLVAGPYQGTVNTTTGVANSGLHSWTPQAVGTYYWVATFSGDANNAAITEGVGCGDSAEAVTVTPAQPAIATTPSISTAQAVPVTVSDTAKVTGGFNPAGTVTFALYGPFTTAPSAGDCANATNLVAGMSAFANVPLVNGSATSPGYPVTQSGIYQWVATFSDTSGNNLPAAGACGDTTEQFTTFTAAVLPVVTPAKTGDMSIFMVLGIPFIVTGLILFGLSWRRREEQA